MDRILFQHPFMMIGGMPTQWNLEIQCNRNGVTEICRALRAIWGSGNPEKGHIMLSFETINELTQKFVPAAMFFL